MTDQIKNSVQDEATMKPVKENCPDCGSSKTYYNDHANLNLPEGASRSGWCDDCGHGFRATPK